MRRKRIKVVYTKLGRQKAFGQAHSDGNVIEIDERVKGKKHLEILLHEAFHIISPEKEEEQIVSESVMLTNLLWQECYRRIDNNKSEPLQDGKK